MAFSLPPLPYATGDLAANGMCQETLELHHGKHHNAYVTALNGLVESKGLGGKSLEAICADVGKQGADGLPVLNQAGQHYNHCLFWQVMAPGGSHGSSLPAALAKPRSTATSAASMPSRMPSSRPAPRSSAPAGPG